MWESILAGGIAAGGSVLGGIFGEEGADKSAKFGYKMYKKASKDFKPWRKAGKQALAELQRYIKDPSLVTEMPGYEFAFDEGTKALLRSRAATEDLQSGATGKALTRYGQQYATTNWLNYLSPYRDLSQAGQAATAQTAQVGTSLTPSVMQSQLAGAGARVGAVGGVTNALTSAIKDYYYMKEMDRMRNVLAKPTPRTEIWRPY